MARFRKTNSGQSLVEFLVAVGIAAAILPAILTGFITSREGKVSQDLRLRATSYLKEAQEATRVAREASWNTFAVNGTYRPVISGNTWSLATGDETISDFTRSVEIADISPSDPSIKLVTITVSWGGSAISSVTSSEYFTRYLENSVLSETQTVQPNAGGFGNWCNPSQSVTTVDLSRQGVPTSVWAFEPTDGTGNRVFAGTGGNSSGPAFTNTKIVGNSPPTATDLGGYNDTPKIKVNGVFGDVDYAYLATDNHSKEVLIVNLTSPYSEAGYFDAPGNGNGNSVYVSGDIGYMTTGNKFYTFDLSSKSGSRGQLGTVTLPGTGEKIVVIGNYAYVAISGATTKMQIVNIENSNYPTLAGAYVNSSLADGRDVFVSPNGTRAYLVTATSSTQPEFFIINTSTLTSVGSYETGMDPTGVAIVSGSKAIIVGKDGSDAHPEYQVINIDNESSLTICTTNGTGTIRVPDDINAISSVSQSDGHAYSYIVTGDTNAELKIIEGGIGGVGGSGTGTFESLTLPFPDPGHDVAFNYYTATSDLNLSYKIAIKHGSGGSCAAVTFADGDFYPLPPPPNQIPLTTSTYVNPGQCMRYRAINSGSSPITFTVNFNYSP